ncbi:MAG: hypothetical protein V4671_01905 [Armatimonadota bacterium]
MKLFSQVLPFPLSAKSSATLRTVSVSIAALLLCLMALAQPSPSRADYNIAENSIINYAIDDTVYVYGSAVVDVISPAFITNGGGLRAFDTSVVNMYGGFIEGFLGTEGSSVVNLYGGSIEGLSVSGANSTLNVYGTGLSLAGPYIGMYGRMYYVLTGTLQDGTAIDVPVVLFEDTEANAQISQVHLFNTDPLVALKAQVEKLGTTGTLSAGNTNALLTKLTAAQNAAASGNVAAERDALTAFLNQVKALVRTGKIPTAQGAVLTGAAQAILDSLK